VTVTVLGGAAGTVQAASEKTLYVTVPPAAPTYGPVRVAESVTAVPGGTLILVSSEVAGERAVVTVVAAGVTQVTLAVAFWLTPDESV
jgi:hypothetical protein